MRLTQEDKYRITARAFFTDCRDQYEDYHEALAEFMNKENTSPEFIDFCVKPYIEPKDGHNIIINKDGHVGSVRLTDGFFEPRTEMTEDEVDEMQEAFHNAADEFPDIKEMDLLIKIGWKVIA